MIYPKIKHKKTNLKSHISNIIYDKKNNIYNLIISLRSMDGFIMFMKKNFHF